MLFLSSLLLLFLPVIVQSASVPAQLYSPIIAQKLASFASSYNGTYPQWTDHANPARWINFPADKWTSAFFPATLYEMNTRRTLCPDLAGGAKADWLGLGRGWDDGLIPLEIKNTVNHDVGFLSFPFIEELKLNPSNQSAINAINNFATLLAARYNPKVGCTRSWNSPDPDFEVIIDNMMNLNVLFASYNLTGNTTLRDIAISHADKTMVNHFRADGSTFHLVHYSTITGDVTSQVTNQGYSNSSTWTRGQAWAIHGFATMYQNTNLQRYLDTTRRAAQLFLTRLPSSGITPWDFDAPTPAPADTSAATIASSGILLLASFERAAGNNTGATYWSDAAINLLSATTDLAWKPDWQSLLSNGTVNGPQKNNSTGIVYGDYYYVKAGNALLAQNLTSCAALVQTSSGGGSGTTTSSSPGSTNTGKPNSSKRNLVLGAKIWSVVTFGLVLGWMTVG